MLRSGDSHNGNWFTETQGTFFFLSSWNLSGFTGAVLVAGAKEKKSSQGLIMTEFELILLKELTV